MMLQITDSIHSCRFYKEDVFYYETAGKTYITIKFRNQLRRKDFQFNTSVDRDCVIKNLDKEFGDIKELLTKD